MHGGTLEEEDKFTFHNSDKLYLGARSFMFFALHEKKIICFVVLKRLDENTYEFAKLFYPSTRNIGTATKLIERCIIRCKENKLQT